MAETDERFIDRMEHDWVHDIVPSSDDAYRLFALARRGAEADQHQAAVEFTRWVIRNSAWQGGSLDGGDVQEMAEKMGIVERRIATAENRDEWQFIDFTGIGDPFYVFAEWIKPPLPPPPKGESDE